MTWNKELQFIGPVPNHGLVLATLSSPWWCWLKPAVFYHKMQAEAKRRPISIFMLPSSRVEVGGEGSKARWVGYLVPLPVAYSDRKAERRPLDGYTLSSLMFLFGSVTWEMVLSVLPGPSSFTDVFPLARSHSLPHDPECCF